MLEVVGRHLGVRPSEFCERRRHSVLRPVAARMLVKYAGLTLRGVADTLGMKSGAAAGQQVAKVAAMITSDRATSRLVVAIEEALDKQIAETQCD